jgi:hypothetical protein
MSYKSLRTNKRHHALLVARMAREDQAAERIRATDNYTEQDRATAETLEAADLLREFIATELA